jgi:N-glycosylase/DNA lyase
MIKHQAQWAKPSAACQKVFPVRDYDLAATLTSGQVFRWEPRDGSWEGVVGNRWVRLRAVDGHLQATTGQPEENWDWLAYFLQVNVDWAVVVAAFPEDLSLRAAVAACRGLRLLRQDPWECLASFILSSSKQICQIRQIVQLLCERYGERIPAPGQATRFAFPSPARLAQCREGELRECKMGFRAKYLLATAKVLAQQELDLAELSHLTLAEARAVLLELPGVGRKIADCVLLFAYGFPTAFPVDVWVRKALQQLYFPTRRISPRELQQFAEAYFGPQAGYAQQYLFHFMRTRPRATISELLVGTPSPAA